MGDSYRRHAVVDAPVEDVWSVISDPGTHPEWWPELMGVVPPEDGVEEGDAYTRQTRRFGFADVVDTVWVAERVEHLKEAHFRCTVSGTYVRFSVTPAQDNTFVEVESGIDPTNLRWKINQKLLSGVFMPRWLGEMLERLPRAVKGHSGDEGES